MSLDLKTALIQDKIRRCLKSLYLPAPVETKTPIQYYGIRPPIKKQSWGQV
jgi:hypothetical protein